MQFKTDKYKDLFPDIKFDDEVVHHFTNKNEEYKALIHGVGLRLFPSNVLLLSGKDVKDFLHRVSTNEINAIEENHYTTTLFTNEKGRIIDKTLFLNLGEHYYLIGHFNKINLLDRWVERYIISEDVSVVNLSEKKCVFEILGPQAESYLTMFCGNCIDSLNYDNILDIDIEDVKGKIIKTKLIDNSPRFLLMVDLDAEMKVINHFLKQNSVFDFALIGDDAYNSYRVENGIPAYPNELNDNFNPHEANIIDHVSKTKGCYIGQEIIARLDTYDKVQRELKHFVFSDEFEFNGQSHPIKDSDGEDMGLITTIVRSPKYNSILGLGYVRRKYIDRMRESKIQINGSEVRFDLKDLSD